MSSWPVVGGEALVDIGISLLCLETPGPSAPYRAMPSMQPSLMAHPAPALGPVPAVSAGGPRVRGLPLCVRELSEGRASGLVFSVTWEPGTAIGI